MANGCLPNELILAVVEEISQSLSYGSLSSRPDKPLGEVDGHKQAKATLSSCALVCSTWRGLAQPHLFLDFSVRFHGDTAEDKQTWGAFQAFVKSSTRIFKYTHSIALSFEHTRVGEAFGLNSNNALALPLQAVDFSALLSSIYSLKKLRYLAIHGADVTMPMETYSMTAHPALLEEVHVMDSAISFARGNADLWVMPQVLAAFSGVKTLTFTRCNILGPAQPHRMPQVRSDNLQTLCLSECSAIGPLLEPCSLLPKGSFPALQNVQLGIITSGDADALREFIGSVADQLTTLSLQFDYSNLDDALTGGNLSLGLRSCSRLRTVRLIIDLSRMQSVGDILDMWITVSRLTQRLATSAGTAPPLEHLVLMYGADGAAATQTGLDLRTQRAIMRLIDIAIMSEPNRVKKVILKPLPWRGDTFDPAHCADLQRCFPTLVSRGMLAFVETT